MKKIISFIILFLLTFTLYAQRVYDLSVAGDTTKVKNLVIKQGGKIYASPTVTTLGLLYSANSWSSISEFNTLNGANITLNGNNLKLNTPGIYCKKDTTFYEFWHRTIVFHANASATSYTHGIGIGSHGTGTYKFDTYAQLDLSSDPVNGGHLSINVSATVGNVAQSVAALSFSANDLLQITIDRVGNVINAYARDITTNSNIISVSYTWGTAYSPTVINLNNTGVTSIWNFSPSSSQYTVDSLSYSSDEVVGADVAFVGNSIFQGVGATSYYHSIPNQCRSIFDNVVNSAAGGDDAQATFSRLQSIIALKPKQIVFDQEVNDTDLPTLEYWHKRFTDSLTAHKIPYYVIDGFYRLKSVGADINAKRAWVVQQYGNKTIKLYDILKKELGKNANSPDSVHNSSRCDSVAFRYMVTCGQLIGTHSYQDKISYQQFFHGGKGQTFSMVTTGYSFTNDNYVPYFQMSPPGQDSWIGDPNDNGTGHLARIVWKPTFGGIGAVFFYNYDGGSFAMYNGYLVNNMAIGMLSRSYGSNQGASPVINFVGSTMTVNTIPGSSGVYVFSPTGLQLNNVYNPHDISMLLDPYSTTQGIGSVCLTTAQRDAIPKTSVVFISGSGGTGYVNGEYVDFTGGGSDGNGAVAQVVATGGSLIELNLVNPGYSYTSTPTPVFLHGTGATVTITMGWKNGLYCFNTDTQHINIVSNNTWKELKYSTD